jgi:hypothetical protein
MVISPLLMVSSGLDRPSAHGLLSPPKHAVKPDVFAVDTVGGQDADARRNSAEKPP